MEKAQKIEPKLNQTLEIWAQVYVKTDWPRLVYLAEV